MGVNGICKKVLGRFQLDAPVASCERYGCGHVNETYLVVSEKGCRYILRKISSRAFRDIPSLMQNIISVTDFLWTPCDDPRGVLTLVSSNDGEQCIRDDAGEY